MSEEKRSRLKQWLASGEARLQPLTLPQRELWEASPVPAGDPANHICCLIHVRGGLTPNEAKSALQQVVERQEALRLSFLPGKDGPLQMVRRSGEANLEFRDLAPAECSTEAVEEIASEIFRRPFDLLQGPLYRAEILRRAVDEHVIVLAIHHAIADGWSLGVFVHDLCGAYLNGLMGIKDPLPAVPLSYTAWGAADCAFWKPEEIESRTAFWKAKLAGARRLWSTTGDAKPHTALPRRWVTHYPAEVANGARELARQQGATLFSTLLAAFQITLSQWTGAVDIVVGTPVANRGKQAVRESMGSCAGIVPLRGQVDHTRPFSESVRAVHETTVESFANAMPFVELAQALGEPKTPGYNPLFEVRFALQNHPVPEVALPTLSAKLSMRSTGTARFDLGCEITEQGEALEVVWLSRPEMFAPAQIEELNRIFQTFLADACRASESRAA